MLTLLLGRWLLGFCFPHRDLALLDDPLPKGLYCRRFRDESPTKDIEVRLEEAEPQGAELQEGGHDAVAGGEVDVNDTVTNEPTTYEKLSARNALFGENKDFNITQEMDNCDLWKNLVKNYDAPPQSPHRSSQNKKSSPVTVKVTVEESHETDSQFPSACRRLNMYESTAV